MLEIFILITLGRNIANKAAEKGRRGWPYVLLMVLLWFAGEIFGAIVGTVVAIMMNPDEPSLLIGYGGALAGAAVGGLVSWIIVSSLPDANHYDDDRHDDDRHDDDQYGDQASRYGQ